MFEMLVQVTDLPVDGRDFSFGEQRIWTDPIAEFSAPFRINEPLRADLRIQPHQDGCTVQGSMRGSLRMTCDRCVEEFVQNIDVAIHEFESFPGEHAAPEDVCWIMIRDGLLHLDVAGFLWEQLLLAVPEKPLCDVLCHGICAQCGANKNMAPCSCDQQAEDSRMRIFRAMHVS